MAEPQDGTEPDRGVGMLSRISDEIVRMQRQYYGKGPQSAKSYMLDDFLMVVMRDSVTQSELTMLEFGEQDLVRQFRQTFQNRMDETLVGKIEEVTGRKVITYQSQILFDPHIVIEIFFFDRPADEEHTHETAVGQLEDRSVGEAQNTE